jgi:hypothetical protein
MTAPETCQALTEGGIIATRRYSLIYASTGICIHETCWIISNMIQYMRARKHLGVKRSVTFFEFIRAYAALRYDTLSATFMIEFDH